MNEKDSKHLSSHLSDYIIEGYNLWIDISTDTTNSHCDLERLQQSFCLDEDAIRAIKNGSKRSQARILKDHIFTIFLDLQYRNLKEVDANAIYFFLGRGWLITIHGQNIDLVKMGRKAFFEEEHGDS